jgi:hypothetical protein
VTLSRRSSLGSTELAFSDVTDDGSSWVGGTHSASSTISGSPSWRKSIEIRATVFLP